MKKNILLLLLSLLFSFQIFAQRQEMLLTDDILIKDTNGKTISIERFSELINTGEYNAEPVEDKDGNLKMLQLHKIIPGETTTLKSSTRTTRRSHGERSPLIGHAAPDFVMTDLEGNEIDSKKLRGKVVVLNFWFARCKPCIDEVPELNQVFKKYQSNKEVVFAAVTFEKEEAARNFRSTHGFLFPLVPYRQEVVDEFVAFGYPTNVVLDREGKFHYYKGGGYPNLSEHLFKAIDDALAGLAPEEPLTSTTETIHFSSDSTYKLENGKVIDVDKAFDLMATNNYDLFPKKDKAGNEYYLLKKRK